MKTIPSQRMLWILLISTVVLGLHTSILANDPVSTPGLERLKQIRQLQNENAIIANVKSNKVQVIATPEQQRMLKVAKSKVAGGRPVRFDQHERHGLRLGQPDRAPAQTHNDVRREVLYNSGLMSAEPGFEYFNFLLGTNSSDSVGMDVRITGNEGTNFGNEGASWGEPSLLYFHAPMGTLDDIHVVPTIDEPDFPWTTISWDWNGGNNGQPLAVGNLWVIYASTSGMYVGLEVTAVDPGNQYFEFNYKIQTDGSNVFDTAPQMFDMTVNGLQADTIEIGSIPYFEINLNGSAEFDFSVTWDANHNGQWDGGDFHIGTYPLTDDDIYDADPTPGVYGLTYSADFTDEFVNILDDLVFRASSSTGIAEVSIHYYALPTAYSVSGTVYDVAHEVPLPGIAVWVAYESSEYPYIICATDDLGNFHLDLPTSGPVEVGVEDLFDVAQGLHPVNQTMTTSVDAHVTGLDFYYDQLTSGIQGYVYDEIGTPLSGVDVYAGNHYEGYWQTTDENGFYEFLLTVGEYWVDLSLGVLFEEYLTPHGEYVLVGDFAMQQHDIYAQSANNTISGTVLLDGSPIEGAHVHAHHPTFGYTWRPTDEAGNFSLGVFDNNGTIYDIYAEVYDVPSAYLISGSPELPAGSTGEIYEFETVAGGLFGYFINGETNLPIADTYDLGFQARNIATNMNYWGYPSGPDPDGAYELYLPEGFYEIMGWGLDWLNDGLDTVEVVDQMVPFDILLWPVVMDTYVEGYVYNEQGTPIPYAHVYIGNEWWGDSQPCDENGFYHLEVPFGHYFMEAYADNHYREWLEIDLDQGPFFHDFYLEEYFLEGAISGTVYEGNSGALLPGASVSVYNNLIHWGGHTDDLGLFWFDVPNGEYSLWVAYEGFDNYFVDSIIVVDDTLYMEIPLYTFDGGVEGHVYDAIEGTPIPGADVYLFSTEDPELSFHGFTDDFGYYSIESFSGEYELYAHAPGYEGSSFGFVDINQNWIYQDLYLELYQSTMAPEISLLIDQPDDQGRWMRMRFWPGYTDWGNFSGYSIWRYSPTPTGVSIMDFVDYIPNHDFGEYSLVVPTLVDSSAHNSTPDVYGTSFWVTGHWDTYGYIDGEWAFGYSIDNIHPGVPGQLLLLSATETSVEIAWDASMADDFQYFEVHRSNNPDFVDAHINFTAEPMHHDIAVEVGQTYYYKVQAVDANGNVGEATNVVTTSIVSINKSDMLPTAYGLSQNYPNPFNPTTSIEFALPEAADVSLEIYNLLGQKVRTLVNGYVSAGYVTTRWDGLDQHGQEVGSGTYIYRLKTTDQSFSKKLVLMK